MSRVLPKPHQAQQLCRLRSLRVKRARARCSEVQTEVERATEAVCARQRQIERTRREIDALAHAVVHALAPRLPRWGNMAAAQRDRLHERLERDESALIDDEHALEQAHERLQQARADLTRALSREDAVRGLADESRRDRVRQLERRAETELEDQGRPAAALEKQPA
jgi:hypothetical protein